ncbi:hypothetical protein [Agromyces laixinhei]|uniref:hypothetical protein n=1 Tax=Agromyces laixinhei TaxID=2585717 RepID=UPI001E3A593B|nr:hypothetical protein [Agromyces laixinhei]
MIDIETLTRLKQMRLSGMAEYFENLAEVTSAAPLTGPEMIKQAVDWNTTEGATANCTGYAVRQDSPSPPPTSRTSR